MREILFRGKRIDNGEWVEGDLSYHVHDGEVYVFPGNGYDSSDNYEVDSETVCQYTGSTDKNGRKIFEGDIIKYSKKLYKIVWVAECAHFAAYPLQENSWSPCMNAGTVKNVEVIGNIFDNLDLVEVRDERKH